MEAAGKGMGRAVVVIGFSGCVLMISVFIVRKRRGASESTVYNHAACRAWAENNFMRRPVSTFAFVLLFAVSLLAQGPLTALLAAWLLAEPLTGSLLLGGALVLLGVGLANRGRDPAEETNAAVFETE